MLLGFRTDSQNKGYLNTPKMEVGIEIWRNIHEYSVVRLSNVCLWLTHIRQITIITDKLLIEVFVRAMASAFQNRKVRHFIHSLAVCSCKQSSFPRYWNTLQLLKLWHQKKWNVGSAETNTLSSRGHVLMNWWIHQKQKGWLLEFSVSPLTVLHSPQNLVYWRCLLESTNVLWEAKSLIVMTLILLCTQTGK